MNRRTFLKNNLIVGASAFAGGAPLGHSRFQPCATELREAPVVIYGATPSGITSAIRVARSGYNVILINYFPHIGGMFSNGLCIMDTIYEGHRAPLYEEFLERIRAYYSSLYGKESTNYEQAIFGDPDTSSNRPRFEPHVAQKLLEDWVASESRVQLLTGYELLRVERRDRRIQSITIFHNETRRELIIRGEVFMDASYEADLAAMAKVEYVVGREARNEYDEQHAGKLFGLRGKGKFPYEAAIGQLNLRTFHVVSQQIMAGSTGEGDKAVQAYNPRFVLTDNPANRVDIAKPEGYDRERYLPITADRKLNHLTPCPVKADLLTEDIHGVGMGFPLMNRKFGNNLGNYTGMNWAYPEADWKTRKRIIGEHVNHALGLIYFLQHDESVPAAVRDRVKEYGLSKDEFVDNGHIPYELYVREARRIRGRYVFTENDASLAGGIDRTPIHDDAIAIAEWPMDSHDCSTDRVAGSLHDGIVLLTEKTRPSQIPYRALLPKEVDNLLVTVCVSSTHMGWGTIRVEPTLMHIAESAAIAATLSLKSGILPVAVSVRGLQLSLAENRIMLSFFNEFDAKSSEEWSAAVQFFGTKGFFHGYRADLDALVTDSLAEIWLGGLSRLLSNSDADPMVLARAVSEEASKTSRNMISRQGFLDKLRAFTTSKGVPLNKVLGDVQEEGVPKFLSKRECCVVMYRIVKYFA